MSELAEERLGMLWIGAVLTHWRGLLTSLILLLAALIVLTGGPTAPALRQIGAPWAEKPVETTPTTTTSIPPARVNVVAVGHPQESVVLADRAPTITTTPVWEPADECADVDTSRLVLGTGLATMAWCPYTAQTLYETGNWQPGDLTRLMVINSCESGGDPLATNEGGMVGLFQHHPRYLSERLPDALANFAGDGWDNPDLWMGFDNIRLGVYLAKVDGNADGIADGGSWTHWTCWTRYQ